MSAPLLSVDGLSVSFHTDGGEVKAVDNMSFSVAPGKTLGVVGESGSGKSVSNMTILGLTRADNADIRGEITFDGRDLIELDNEGLREVRGNDIAMIFQDPLTSLHPFYRVGWQLVEAVQAHRDLSDSEARDRAIELLGLVGIPDPERRFGEYPHEFSGGMRQRVMIAMALINEPKLLIADEPTTALDVTIQAQILRLLKRLQAELGMAMILITHDLGVVVEVADEIVVMYGGRVVERGSVEDIFYDPQHPYTWGLLGSVARVDGSRHRKAHPDRRPAAVPDLPAGGMPFPHALPARVRSLLERPSPSAERGGSPRSLLAHARGEAQAAHPRYG